MSTNTGFFVDEASKKRILDKLDKLPDNLKRNALSSALNAGAKVIAQRAKAKAPACLVPSIKVKRRKQDKYGNVRVAVVAGRGRSAANDPLSNLLSNAATAKFLSENSTAKIVGCTPAIWVELGTYGHRNIVKHPYAPDTLTKRRYYGNRYVGTYATNGGKSPSPYWENKPMWEMPRPFMRPAFLSAEADGSVRNAIIQKLDTYIDKKLGV